jgi:protein-S-isoprenylcysteine O-methyltransferase Ste14
MATCMSSELAPRTERRLRRAVDVGERIFIVLLFAAFAASIWQSFALKPFNILAVLSEGLLVFFILIRRDATVFTMRSYDWAIALGGTALPMVARPGGHPLVPSIISAMLMLAGLLVTIASKLTIRRSFGVAAANRGVVWEGPYRLVRHPMYAGYVLVYMGFFLNNPLVRNFAIYIFTIMMLVARIFAEERVLAKDPAYASLMSRVRYRLVPGIF